jgi:transposase
MRSIKKIIYLSYQSQLSVREISGALDIPKSTVSDYLLRFRESGLSLSDLEEKDSEALYALLFPKPPEKVAAPRKALPDFIQIHQELKRKHVTRLLLWEEYREAHPDGYGYTQFCELYNRWRKTLSISMRQVHKAGEKMFVDYSGLTMEIIDPESGETYPAEIFVAVLGASGYTFAEASCDQKKGSFIASHINALEFFGGVSEILIPDNLKSGVTSADWYEPLLNESYQDMAEHYGAVVIPARPYTPKDKPKVELSVKLVQRWILARLRHRQFFSIEELNEAIFELLDSLNRRPMKKFGKSRYDLYLELDRPALRALPSQPYRLRQFKVSRVNIEYHVEVEKSYYSVPYQLIDKEVYIRYSDKLVEIFYNNKRIALHRRLHQAGAYSTQEAHMAAAHRAYAHQTPSNLIGRAERFGEKTKALVIEILKRRPHPQMGIRSCSGILKAARHLEAEVMEAICEKMLELESYTLAHFKSILKHKTYMKAEPQTATTPESIHENIRGNQYYD